MFLLKNALDIGKYNVFKWWGARNPLRQLVDDAYYPQCPPPAPSHGRGIFIITHLPGVTLRSPPAVNCRPSRAKKDAYTPLWHSPRRPCVKNHMQSFAHISYISARCRSTEMCPCDVACKTVRLVENHIQSFTYFALAFRRHAWEKACAARFFIAPSCSTEQEIAFLR